jgi:hypothetical protein
LCLLEALFLVEIPPTGPHDQLQAADNTFELPELLRHSSDRRAPTKIQYIPPTLLSFPERRNGIKKMEASIKGAEERERGKT